MISRIAVWGLCLWVSVLPVTATTLPELKEQIRIQLKHQFAETRIKRIDVTIRNPRVLDQYSSDTPLEAVFDSSSRHGRRHKVLVSDKSGKRVSLICDIDVWAEIPRSVSVIPRDQVISTANVAYRLSNISALPEHILTSISQLIGKATKGGVGKGSFFTPNMLKSVPLVKNGDTINLIVLSDGIRLKLSGVSMQSGGLHDTVSVKSQYKKILKGEVIGKKTVLVTFNH